MSYASGKSTSLMSLKIFMSCIDTNFCVFILSTHESIKFVVEDVICRGVSDQDKGKEMVYLRESWREEGFS